MKRIILLLSLLVFCFTCKAQENEEAVIKRCAARVRVAIRMTLDNTPPINVSKSIDSLYSRLVTNPVDIKVTTKYIGMIPMQAYFLLADDKRVDYKAVDECLFVCGKFDAFLDLSYLVCAILYGEWAQENMSNKALDVYLLADKANAHVFGNKRSPFTDSINLNISKIYFDHRKWKDAIVYQERIVEASQEGTEEHYHSLETLGFLNDMSERYEQADSCYGICQHFLEKNGAIGEEEHIDILLSRALIKIHAARYQEAEQMLLNIEKLYKQDDPKIVGIWKELSGIYQDCGETKKEYEVFRKALSFYEKHFDAESAPLLMQWIAECNNPFVKNEGERMLALLEGLLPTDDVPTLCVLCRMYQKTGMYDKAASTCSMIENIISKMSEDDLIDNYNHISQMYFSLNMFPKVIELSKRDLKSIEKLVGKQHPLYKETLAILGEDYFFNGEFYKALEVYETCLAMDDADEEFCQDIYEKVASTYSAIGEYELSNKYADYVLNITNKPKLRIELLYLMAGNIISELDIRRVDINEVSRLHTDSLKQLALSKAEELNSLCLKTFGESHVRTIESYHYLASAYNLLGDKANMQKYASKSEQLIRKYVNNNDLKRTYLESLSTFYFYAKDYKKALSLIDTKVLDDPNALSVSKDFSLFALSEINLALNRHSEAQKYYTDLADLRIDLLSQQMSTLTSQARQQYWRKYRQEMQNAAKFVNKLGEQDEFAGVVYNLSLYSKRLLLGSDNAFRFAILESYNKELKDKFEQLGTLKSTLSQNRISKTSAEYVQMQKQADAIEKELLATIKSGTNTADKTLWQDIRNALTLDAIAIEMLEYKDKDEHDQYGVVMIRKDWKFPLFLCLGDKHDIDKQMNESGLLPKNAMNVWTPILPYLDNVKNIFISPVGIFHQIPIEYMPDVKKYSVFRLTSTGELCQHKESINNNAVIYGGLIYKDGLKQAITATLNDRGTITLPYLSGTLVEADSIASILSPEIKLETKTGLDGTEQSFKALSGKRIGILHIATHGTYTESSSNSNKLLRNVASQEIGEDHALTRSCLFMSGALNALNAKDGNDGILTAIEVSVLDFRGLDLVTLSACETAKGDVTGDGVFGLQRGFKKAGAKSILMSLRKVDDNATQCLMTDFYEQLKQGSPKQEALRHAREKVRSNVKWSSPEYWAPFILLDAVPEK